MERLLTCAMDIGEQLLISGAEVHRVEESIERMCRAFGFSRTDVFIITSSMVVTSYDQDGTPYTQTRRITTSTIDIERIHRLNALSRKICSTKTTEEEIRKDLADALSGKRYGFWTELLCYMMIAGAFTLFFGCTMTETITPLLVTETIISLLVGGIVRVGILLWELAVNRPIFTKFMSAAVATALAYGAVKLGWINSVDKIIIGNIMTLIPGIGLTVALRDLFTGDSIAGLLRTIEAILTALAIAAGYFLVAALGGFAL